MIAMTTIRWVWFVYRGFHICICCMFCSIDVLIMHTYAHHSLVHECSMFFWLRNAFLDACMCWNNHFITVDLFSCIFGLPHFICMVAVASAFDDMWNGSFWKKRRRSMPGTKQLRLFCRNKLQKRNLVEQIKTQQITAVSSANWAPCAPQETP